MKRSVRLLAVGSLCAVTLLAGCPSPLRVQHSGPPAEVSRAVESGRFPLQVGSYRRGKIAVYHPVVANYSIEYDRYDNVLQHAVTLYYYPRSSRMEEQFTGEKMTVLRGHPGATLTAERRLLMWKDGYSFQAFIATFEFDAMFAGRDQRLSSQLILVALPDQSFKVRSSAPVAQASAAESGTLELLEAIDWARR